MKPSATFASLAAACAIAAALTVAAPASAGLHLNGPSLDGQTVALPDRLASTSEANALSINGPALDGRKVALPGGPARAIR